MGQIATEADTGTMEQCTVNLSIMKRPVQGLATFLAHAQPGIQAQINLTCLTKQLPIKGKMLEAKPLQISL